MADAGKVSLRPRGRFNINETYERLDFVKYNTGCYVALQTTSGNLPTDTTNFMNLIDFDIANMSQIGNSNTIDADGTLHAHAVGSVTSFNGRTDEVLPQTGDYTAAQVGYDNTDSNLSANNVKAGLDELDADKTDTTVIAPKETGASASRAYAIGEHFIKDGAFCTAKTAIAQGETFTLNTNYTDGDIGSVISSLNSEILNTINLNSNYTMQYCIVNKIVVFTIYRNSATSAVVDINLPLPFTTKINIGIHAYNESGFIELSGTICRIYHQANSGWFKVSGMTVIE